MKKYNGFVKLACLCLLCPLLIWELSLKKTYQLYRDSKLLDTEIANIRLAPADGSKPDTTLTSATPILSNGKLLDIANALKGEVEIAGYTPTLLNENAGDKLYRGVLLLRGGFIPLVKTIQAFEAERLPAKISSARFAAVKPVGQEKRVKQVELALTFLQVEQ
jgi:hypothetical protein